MISLSCVRLHQKAPALQWHPGHSRTGAARFRVTTLFCAVLATVRLSRSKLTLRPDNGRTAPPQPCRTVRCGAPGPFSAAPSAFRSHRPKLALPYLAAYFPLHRVCNMVILFYNSCAAMSIFGLYSGFTGCASPAGHPPRQRPVLPPSACAMSRLARSSGPRSCMMRSSAIRAVGADSEIA